MSSPLPSVRTYAAVVLTAIVVIATGCSDSLITSQDSGRSAGSGADGKIVPGDKTRHFGMLDQATYTRAGKTGEEETVVNLLVKYSSDDVSSQGIIDRYGIIDPYGIIDRFGIIDRYGIIDPYGILEVFGIIDRFGIIQRFQYEHVFDGMAISVDNEHLANFLERIQDDSDIARVEPDLSVGSPVGDLTSLRGGSSQITPWAVDAVGASSRSSFSDEDIVDVYVLDTGTTHEDINVRSCSRIEEDGDSETGYLLVDCQSGDENGHGTAVASLAGAIDDQDGIVGVAPGVRIHAVKVLDGDGRGTTGAVVAALDKLVGNNDADGDGQVDEPMVINLSLGTDVTEAEDDGWVLMDEAVRGAIDAGAFVTVAAGNGSADAEDFSPAHVAEALTIGSYGQSGGFSSFSNYGKHVDLLAPGENVETLWGSLGVKTYSGTSISAPQAAGAAARYLASNPDASPAQVHDAIVGAATETVTGPHGGIYGKLDVSGF